MGALNRKELLSKLNFFYGLELQQVDLYDAQSRQLWRTSSSLIDEDLHTAWSANKLKELEHRH
ncbi:hypothetical protein [Candidatus Desulforudis audaxviator]|uniref:hypothetical protein n=1 Tax=Candidatus Desulforudis audaxviator TaxID=471827 RepID=UPI0002F03472|nr:hypothetical protein [Candidatus Desulforudis audaxviator]AZK58743.1 hypothetical protein Daudx_0185 [Candidatus Desulforudis audaxviator]